MMPMRAHIINIVISGLWTSVALAVGTEAPPIYNFLFVRGSQSQKGKRGQVRKEPIQSLYKKRIILSR